MKKNKKKVVKKPKKKVAKKIVVPATQSALHVDALNTISHFYPRRSVFE